MTKPQTLTPKQSAFAAFVAKGLSYSDAYRKAYESKASDASVNVEASRMMKKEHIRKAVEDLRADKKEAKSAHKKLSREWVLEMLKKEAMDTDNPPSTRVRALELLGKAEGAFDDTTRMVVEHRSPEDIESELERKLSRFFDS
jgi:hypothetical protein